MRTFRNPVMSGFYPDPSVIRVGEDYYLVTSSFEFFPGVPIFHSKDLVNWRQLGHALDRPSQLNLDGILPSRGIWAPTIRFHNGMFYMITTFVDNDKNPHNFYVTAPDPAGDWSDPIWLEDAPGIDPSLFFDDDGKVYYTGNRVPPEGQQYPKHMDIWLQEIDLNKGRLVGEKTGIWQGALKAAHAQEGPHVYKIGGWYYLLIAEGGTGHTHAITIARSRNVTGPYEGHKANPILTHRHLGREFPIVNVGHGELVETQHGEWWLFCLASRTSGGYYRNLGRETFLAPVQWENEWPVVSPGKGMLEFEAPAPDLPETARPSLSLREDFGGPALSPVWNFLRTPRGDFWSTGGESGGLRLNLKPEKLTDIANPSLIARRQQHLDFRAAAQLSFKPADGETAGLVLFQNADHHFRLEYGRTGGGPRLALTVRRGGEERELASAPRAGERIQLKVEARGQSYSFYFRADERDKWEALHEGADGRVLSTDLAGGFTGAYIGLYASSNGAACGNHADFAWFDYEGRE
ncbi:glycoside hydrolase family 43 protein [Saccharibacillus sp. CPCC 101409]|uniref:glycoside hydrolase family 43 protein n=1 Tax=Saccharibacillus sp. CPCC 101409 TaxID=3058041 RepID=UPI002671EE2C|nr:glycoside hydrolase family 43 protein [Saccharibacillus sp. CPCC 101409]MDO3412380.1 glycoside hydrolase family 43 protein [Saccharibacillus sp. CPCC 101409]